ncbi:MAG: 7TM-DISM domain-containing protein, partial [Pseudomonadota bacterium]|nr:7TM-DISM domain-containing protein [Pseudomonadota bacterium]
MPVIQLAGQGTGLGPYLEFLEDPEGQLTLEDIRAGAGGDQWVRPGTKVPGFGYTGSTYWARLMLPSAPAYDDDFLLEISYPVLDRVIVHVLQGGERVSYFHLGDRMPYHERPVDHPNLIFPVTLAQDQPTEVYLQVTSSSSVQIPLTLWRSNDLITKTFEQGSLWALFYGALLVLGIYNLLIYMAVRERSYLYYVLYVMSMASLTAAIHGVSFRAFWPNNPGWNEIVPALCL